MDLFRRSEKVPSLFSFDRVLVPLLGDEAAVARADEILRRADAFLARHKVQARSSTVQARAAGPAIVDELNELGAQLVVMGLRYNKRFRGQCDAGRTVPYVMRNSTAPVWCLRAETKELAHTP